MSRNGIPEFFFDKEANALILSTECLKLKEIKTNVWIFELVSVYQTVKFLGNESFQQWFFTKEGNEVVVRCYDIHGNLIQGLFADIGKHYHFFSEITLYVKENICMVQKEYEITMSKPGN